MANYITEAEVRRVRALVARAAKATFALGKKYSYTGSYSKGTKLVASARSMAKVYEELGHSPKRSRLGRRVRG